MTRPACSLTNASCTIQLAASFEAFLQQIMFKGKLNRLVTRSKKKGEASTTELQEADPPVFTDEYWNKLPKRYRDLFDQEKEPKWRKLGRGDPALALLWTAEQENYQSVIKQVRQVLQSLEGIIDYLKNYDDASGSLKDRQKIIEQLQNLHLEADDWLLRRGYDILSEADVDSCYVRDPKELDLGDDPMRTISWNFTQSNAEGKSPVIPGSSQSEGVQYPGTTNFGPEYLQKTADSRSEDTDHGRATQSSKPAGSAITKTTEFTVHFSAKPDGPSSELPVDS